MAQDTTPALVLYVGNGVQTEFEVPFDKGSFGEIKVAFVRRGLTDYTYDPDTYNVKGYLYAWNGGVYTKTETPDTDTPLYDKDGVATGDTWEATMYREPKNDIFTRAYIEWTGEPLTSDDVICIVRETQKDQPYSYPNNQKHIERALDNLSRQIQELQLTADNALKVDPSWNYTMDDENKMDPITWLQTIVRSKGLTLRELRIDNDYIEYTTDDPDSDTKTWNVITGVKTGNGDTVSHIREHVEIIDGTTLKYLQYSVDGGNTWRDSANTSFVRFVNIIGSPYDNTALATELNGKQATISDLETIRSGAAAGAVAETNAKNYADGLVSPINAKIPEQATASNQLADKNFVNSSIATSTATFRGTYTSLADLQAVVGADENDYGFVVSTDTVGNTVYSRYKYTGSTWVFEYNLNNSSFTADQWAAINSNATASNIASIAGKLDKTGGTMTGALGITSITGNNSKTLLGQDSSGGAQVGDLTTNTLLKTAQSRVHAQVSGTATDIELANLSDVVTTLSGLSDTTITTPAVGDALVWNGSAWVNDNTVGGTGSGYNVGDIFWTTRKDSALNGAVECNGVAYNTTDFTGAQSIGSLLAGGKVPYVSLATYASLLSTQGSCGVFGWDGVGTTAFRVPSLNDVFVETGTAAQIGDYIPAGVPNITAELDCILGPQGETINKTGAFTKTVVNNGNGNNRSWIDSTLYMKRVDVKIDASDSDSVYGAANTVQPKAIRYRAMVQLFVSATDEAVATCTAITAQVGTNTSDIAGLKAHEVVEFQAPTAQNNYTWYRKYADGWVEQGGLASAGETAITFDVPMADTNYYPSLTAGRASAWAGDYTPMYYNKTTTGMTIKFDSESTDNCWEIKGMYAQ